MIRGYPRQPSVRPGEVLTLHVSTTSPRFRVAFFRQGADLTPMQGASAESRAGAHVPDGPPDLDWGWPAYDFLIPARWPTGIYVAKLIAIAADGTETEPDAATTFATEGMALFVVRHAGAVERGTILYKTAWATFVAYNGTGYGSLYTEAVWSRTPPHPGFKVTWRRPGCGTGGLVMPGDSEDFYDPSSRRQTFEHWDAPLVRWLEREGYAVHYCSDYDLHREPDLLAPYSLVLSVGHDEYWSDAMRDALDAHVDGGGNIAFFSGNISGYRIHFVDGGTAITCAKIGPATKDPDDWERDSWLEAKSEARITGVATRFGGGWWDGKRDAQGYTVQHTQHWAFAGTGLQDGAVFGDDEAFPLIGYEVDGAAFRWKNGLAVATGECGTPRSFAILGVAELTEGWVTGGRGAAATMGVYGTPAGGTVFQGATTDWPILVPRNRAVEAITRNVLDRLRWPSVRILGPLPHRAGRMIAGAGETVTFHADTGRCGALDGLKVDWQVGGGTIVRASGPVVTVAAGAGGGYLTVAATVSRQDAVLGFGTTTTLLLAAEETQKLEILTNLREMTMAGEPSNPLVAPAYDPVDRNWLLYSIRIPWIRERAERIAKAAAALIAERSRK
jgi:hypothetical protein